MIEAYPGVRASLEDRFWSRVDKTDGCWLWTAATFDSGYGSIQADGKQFRAHRVSWVLAYGEIPDGMFVLHECDTPACVRPTHLFLGTHQDNMADRAAKRRQAKGERVAAARLTAIQVTEIRGRLSSGEFQRALAREFGVCKSTIGYIGRGETWKVP